MAIVTIDDAYLSAIGAAIRRKNGLETTYKPKEMANAIEAIGSEIKSLSVEGTPLTVTDLINGNAYKIIDENIISVSDYGFAAQSSLVEAYLPNCEYLLNGAFHYDTNLTRVEINAHQINSAVFANCSNLVTLINRYEGTRPPWPETGVDMVSSNTFMNTPILNGEGYIYVPASMVGIYRNSDIWSDFSDKIRAIEDYPDICG